MRNDSLVGRLDDRRAPLQFCLETDRLQMIVAGALCLGLVAGWVVEFLSWSWASALYRVTMATGLAVVLIGQGAIATSVGITGVVLGAVAHNAMIKAVRRRRT